MDASQFRQFYKEQSSLLRKVAQKSGAPPSDADDAVHEAYLNALEETTPDSPVLPVLIDTATRNAARRFWRRGQRYLYIDGFDDLENGRPTPEEELQVHRQVEFLMRLINRLPPDRRTVFIMAEIYEEQIPNIAATLGIPLTTAESRLRWARHDLKEAVRLARARGTFPAIMLLFSDISDRLDGLWCRIRSWRPLRHAVGTSAAVIIPGLFPMGSLSTPIEPQSNDQVVLAMADSSESAQIEEIGTRSEPPADPPPAPAAPVEPTQRKPTNAAAPQPDHAAREGLRMLQAQDALTAGHVDAALAELLDLEQQYPDGYYATVRKQMILEIQQYRKQSPRTPPRATRGAK